MDFTCDIRRLVEKYEERVKPQAERVNRSLEPGKAGRGNAGATGSQQRYTPLPASRGLLETVRAFQPIPKGKDFW